MRHSAQYLLPLRGIIAVAAAVLLGPALLTGTGVAATRAPAPASLRMTASAGTWGRAQEVTGINAGGGAGVSSVSCGSAGNCSAGAAPRAWHRSLDSAAPPYNYV